MTDTTTLTIHIDDTNEMVLAIQDSDGIKKSKIPRELMQQLIVAFKNHLYVLDNYTLPDPIEDKPKYNKDNPHPTYSPT